MKKSDDDLAPQYNSLTTVVRGIVEAPLAKVSDQINAGLVDTRFEIHQEADRTVRSINESMARIEPVLNEALICLRHEATGLSAIASRVEDHHNHAERQAADLAQSLADTVGRQAAELRSALDDHVRAIHEHLSAASSVLQSRMNQLASQSAERMEQLTAEQASARQAVDRHAKRHTVLLSAAIVGVWATFALALWQLLAS